MLVRLCLLGLLATAAARVTCPKGVFLEGGSVCAKCTKGQYNHLFDSDHCFMCPSGKFSAEEGAIGCQSCPSGYYTNGDGFESCTACKIGTYGSFEGARSAHTCAQCPAGKFGQKAPLEEDYRNQNGLTRYTVGAPICTHCPDGKYSTAKAQTSCKVCGFPTYSRMGSTMCSKCERGKFLFTKQRTPTCKSCNYKKKDAELCPQCAPGKYQIYKFNEMFHLVTTKDGAHSEKTKAGECYKCPHGTFSNSLGAESCATCPAGYHSNGAGTACSCKKVDCKLGQWSTWTKCSRSCGVGRQVRSRQIVQAPNHCFDAAPCAHTVQQRHCNEDACPPEPTAAPSKPKARTDLKDTKTDSKKMREGKKWTSFCSHVYCEKAQDKPAVIHHQNREKHGVKHLCAMHMHKHGKCGCECTNAKIGNPFTATSKHARLSTHTKA